MAGGKVRSARLAEFLGLVAFALALMLLISLATYDPADPAPFFKAGASGSARNFIGPMGAFLAELMVPQLFGMASLLFPLVLGITGWKLFWCHPIEAPYTKAFGLSLLLLSLTAFLSLTFHTVQIEGEPVRAGGAVGLLLATTLIASFNRTGAYIVLATALFVSLILATQFSFAAFLAAAGRVASARARALRTAWAHFRETRRKERQRREVARKHAQREKEAAPAAGPESLPRVRKVRPPGDEEPDTAAAAAPAAPPVQRPLPFLPAASTPAAGDDDAPKAKRRAAEPPAARGRHLLPPTTLLDEIPSDGGMDKERLYEKARTLQAKSGEFGVLGNVVEIHPGPVVTTYEFKPDAGIKYSKIVGLADDLALALEAESIRIDRMSGRGTVGIEIPNDVR
ncbi:MAG TPA: DNA translocase FtsK 4TM domain-containing protein, partial [Vicinamibacteria bacterium]